MTQSFVTDPTLSVVMSLSLRLLSKTVKPTSLSRSGVIRTHYVDANDDKIKITDLTFLLWAQLKSTKEKLAQENRQVPMISVRPDLYDQRLEMSFHPECNILSLSTHLLTIIGLNDINVDTHLNKISDFYSDPKSGVISIGSNDGKSNMVFKKVATPDEKPVQVSVQLLKSKGFRTGDAQHMIDGYIECFGQPYNISTIVSQPSFQFDPKLAIATPATAAAGDLYKGTPRDSKALNTEKAVQTLQSLGVEVFDKKSNALLTWDSLAGYDSVKRLIQDTIVNALQYPEIYDRVAAQTRVVFESNRPKAVLFEGPPGTGKTLTARILASQCDRALVLIPLESIMSKWYGESEKKLGQIFDACDELGGAIIFVDEIDSLAPSRDSEQGIHESSKRILGILLQRIEGFHGKGKSLLLSATNRKQDLDRALISRFDLMIPYPLPDEATRSEVFKRYAKQFNGEEYKSLAEATEGFSCRSIKEVCEQAERTCAGRLVAEAIRQKIMDAQVVQENDPTAKAATTATATSDTATAELSDSPLLSDYIDCISLHKSSSVPDNSIGEAVGGYTEQLARMMKNLK